MTALELARWFRLQGWTRIPPVTGTRQGPRSLIFYSTAECVESVKRVAMLIQRRDGWLVDLTYEGWGRTQPITRGFCRVADLDDVAVLVASGGPKSVPWQL